jgi:hypothetical protein
MADPALSIVIEDDAGATTVDPDTGTIQTLTDDGGVVVQLDAAHPNKAGKEEDDFYRNLADDIGALELGSITNDLYDAITADDTSRQGYLTTRAKGIDYLGLRLPDPGSSASDGSAPVEGMSKVTNPLLLEAVLKGWASSVGEFLPASGPVKIMDSGDETAGEDELADALERDMNHYLTKVATEYYPDTSHMILWGPYFGGSGFKKIYRCPMRQRPVSESVDAKDLIVSDSTKDLASCERITHQIMMRPSVMKRMKLVGAYRDVALTEPTPRETEVDSKIAGIQGTKASTRPEDQPYTVWECQCEIDLPEFAPGKFKEEGIPLPYLVTMDKDSREVLSIRRDWREEDTDCQRKQLYVRWPYVPGPGFYGTGLLNILGNSTAAMTAAWREALDAGQFASFPAGLIAKIGARQNTNLIRLSPGEFFPIETNGQPISQIAMGLPYRDVTPGLMSMIDRITQQAKEVGGTADLPSGEGVQNVPVGTMLANIEQATKVMQAAHKGMHQAQSEEFDLLFQLFRDNPEDFIRVVQIKNKHALNYWNEGKFLQAIANTSLVPVSDPNVPSHIHRVAKALSLVQLVNLPAFAPRIDPKEALLRVLRAIKEDPEGLVIEPPPQQQMPDPKMVQAEASMMKAHVDLEKARMAAAQIGKQDEQQTMELALRKRIAEIELARAMIIHEADNVRADYESQCERQREAVELAQKERDAEHKRQMDERSTAIDLYKSEKDREVEWYNVTHEKPIKKTKKKGFADGGAVVTTDFLLMQLIEAFGKMAEAQAAPRLIVRDGNGKPIGVRVDYGDGNTTLQ